MKPHPTAANDAAIIAEADHFQINLFLGRGKFLNADVSTIEEAHKVAEEMLADNPSCSRRPIIYAVNAAGRAAPTK